MKSENYIYLHTFQFQEVLECLLKGHTYEADLSKCYFDYNKNKYILNGEFYNKVKSGISVIKEPSIPIYGVYDLLSIYGESGKCISQLPERLFYLSDQFGLTSDRILLELKVPKDLVLLFDPDHEDNEYDIEKVWNPNDEIGEFGLQVLLPYIEPSWLVNYYVIDNDKYFCDEIWNFSPNRKGGLFCKKFSSLVSYDAFLFESAGHLDGVDFSIYKNFNSLLNNN